MNYKEKRSWYKQKGQTTINGSEEIPNAHAWIEMGTSYTHYSVFQPRVLV